MTDTSWCSIPLTSKRCWRKNARLSDRPRVVAWPKRRRKARPCSTPPSPGENRRVVRPRSSSNSFHEKAGERQAFSFIFSLVLFFFLVLVLSSDFFFFPIIP